MACQLVLASAQTAEPGQTLPCTRNSLTRCQRAGLRATGAWLSDSFLSAAVLGWAVILARAAAPDKFHLLRCVAALLPLNAGYKHTERQAVTGAFMLTL